MNMDHQAPISPTLYRLYTVSQGARKISEEQYADLVIYMRAQQAPAFLESHRGETVVVTRYSAEMVNTFAFALWKAEFTTTLVYLRAA